MTTQSQPFQWNPPLDQSCDGMVSHPMFTAGENGAPPDLTIAIPTFRRPALLVEAVRSVLAQSDLTGVELLIVDNDPDSDGADQLIDALPELRGRTVRYHRNSRNVGMFGNWNTCIALARGRWLTILNDDDLLDADFVATIRATLARKPATDAVIGSVRYMDCRSGTADRTSGKPLAERVRDVFRFGLRGSRRLRLQGLFFGNIAGNSLTLVVRKDVAQSIGGYRSDEYPSADYYFNARLARSYRFVQLRRALASVRVDVNESTKPETLLGFLSCQARLQEALVGDEVPKRWARFIPVSLALSADHFSRYWRVPLDRGDIERRIGRPLSDRGSRSFKVFRLLKGGI